MDDKLVVLVVEDHPATKIVLELAIQSFADVNLLSCDTFDSAIMRLATAPHLDLLICDVRLPPSDRTGVDLAEIAVNMFPHLSVLIISGFPIIGAVDFTNRYSFLRKPFDKQQLTGYIEDSFSGFKKQIRG